MLSVTNKPYMLNVIVLSVIMAECRGALLGKARVRVHPGTEHETAR